MKSSLAAAVALAALGLAGTASAQSYGMVDPSLTANYGEVFLRAGFDPDPQSITITSGGSLRASDTASDCVGTVSAAPDLQVTYEADGRPLTFGTVANRDTTLMINGPDGLWSCDDDSGGDGDALITYRNAQSGVYDIWVGSYDGSNEPAELFVTERLP